MDWRELVLVQRVEGVGGPQHAGASRARVLCADENIRGVAAVWILDGKNNVVVIQSPGVQNQGPPESQI